MVDNNGVSAALASDLLDRVPAMTEATVRDVVDAVPDYRRFFASSRGDEVRHQIAIALKTFIRLVSPPPGEDAPGKGDLIRPALEAARAMGRSEVRAGRGTEAVLNAFRVGGRATWDAVAREVSRHGLSGDEVAAMAGTLFDYVDRISAATVAGHQDELTGMLRTRDLERDALARSLLIKGTATPERCARAEWPVPAGVVLVLAESDVARDVASRIAPVPLVVTGGLPGEDVSEHLAVVVIPMADHEDRAAVLSALADRAGVVGPSTALDQVPRAYGWALTLWGAGPAGPLDVAEHLPAVLRRLDPHLVDLMRSRLLGPLAVVPAPTRRSLEATLEAWLRHRGRQDRVAAELFVHTQTVRYRLGRLNELLGPKMHDPNLTLELLLALQTGSGSAQEV